MDQQETTRLSTNLRDSLSAFIAQMLLAWPPMQPCIYSYAIERVAIATIVLKTEQPRSYRLSHCSVIGATMKLRGGARER